MKLLKARVFPQLFSGIVKQVSHPWDFNYHYISRKSCPLKVFDTFDFF